MMWPLWSSELGELYSEGVHTPNEEGGGSAPFHPSDIVGLAAYFDVSTGLVLDTSAPSDSVSQWDAVNDGVSDVSVSQSTKTRQPVVLPNSLGSYSAFQFESSLVSDLSLNGAGCALINNQSGFTAFVVCSPDAVSSDSLLEFSVAGSNSTRWALSLKNVSSQNQVRLSARRQDSDSLVTLTGTTAVSPLNYHVVCATIHYQTGAAAVYVDGALAGSDVSLVSTGTTDATDSNGAKIGRATAGGAIFDGRIADVLVYQQSLSSTDVSDVTGWLQSKLGI